MDNSKLINLLLSLNKDEFKALKKWLRLQAAEKEELLLFNFVAEYYPNFTPRLIEKKRVFRKLFGADKYDDNKMRHLQSTLIGHVERYIVEVLNDDEYAKQFSLLKYYRQRKLDKYFEQQLSLLRKKLGAEMVNDSRFYYYQMLADDEHNKYIKGKQKRTLEPNIQSLSDNLDRYYLINKLAVYSEALNYKNIVKTEYDIALIEPLLHELEISEKLNVPAVKLRHKALQTLMQGDDEIHFTELKALLQQHNEMLGVEEANDLNTLARNYCINRINKGHSKFVRDLFELYQLEINTIDPKSDYELSPPVYKNAVTLAFNLHEVQWAYNFIKNYSQLLPLAQREPNYTFNLARYHFIKREYKTVIGLLSQVEYSDLFMMLSVKILLLKTYYELDEAMPFESLVHSFRALLKNKSGIGYYYANYANFIKLAEKLYRKGRHNKSALKMLSTQIADTKAVAEREWLLEKTGK